MLSRENRILSELIVSRGLASPEAVERRARDLDDASPADLVEALVAHREIDADAGQSVRDEARQISELLQVSLAEGRTLGEYRLLREIGRGGMGIVYEAEQASLGRRVALKVLPATAALDEQLAMRFLREARAVSRLTHPGIVPVFGTGLEQGVLFFTMELVDGETVAQIIERGPMPPREAARIGSELSRALQHAHDAGLIHRDVKPENVILGKDGRARLADFGLVHDLHSARLTRSQWVLGTPAYTAPEQARDAPVDRRCDVYGVGAVLYAMLAGQPPFTGDVPAAVLGRLIQGPPKPLASASRGTPGALVAICERAMARSPDRRYPSAKALADALDGFLAEGDGSSQIRGRTRRTWVGVVAIVAAIVLSLAGIRWLPANGRIERAALAEGSYRLLPTAPGSKGDIALSPNGRVLAFTSAPTPRLFLQDADEVNARRLVAEEEAQSSPAWAPDGLGIAYCGGGRLKLVDVRSGIVRQANEACGPMSWSPDGGRIVYADGERPVTRLQVCDVASGRSRPITGPGAFWPAWSKEGRIAFVAIREGQYDLWTCRDDGSEARRVTDDAARETYPVWSSKPGVLYYVSNRDESPDLWRVQLDAGNGAVRTPPLRLTHEWFRAPFQVTMAAQREIAAIVQEIDLEQAWVLRLDAGFRPSGPPERLTFEDEYDVQLPQRSPSGSEWIAVARRGEGENLRRLGSGSAAGWVTEGSSHDGAPRWSFDGKTIAFHSDRSGSAQIWIVRADGTQLTQITRGPVPAKHPVWSPDGARLAYTTDDGKSWITSSERDAPAALRAGFEPWSWSADGKNLAGTENGIVVLDLASGRVTRVSDWGERPYWAGDSAGLLFTHQSRIFHWRGEGEPIAIWSAGPNLLSSELGLHAGGLEVSFSTIASTERVWQLDLASTVRE